MTQVAEFKVAHLYPPYQGKGLAAIVAADGTKYKCQESQLSQFREGEDVAIHYTDESFTNKAGNAVSFKKLVSKIAKTNATAPQKQFTRATTSKSDSEQIFVVALAKEYISRGDIAADTDSVVKLVNSLRNVWRKTFGGTTAQVDQAMDDEIPY